MLAKWCSMNEAVAEQSRQIQGTSVLCSSLFKPPSGGRSREDCVELAKTVVQNVLRAKLADICVALLWPDTEVQPPLLADPPSIGAPSSVPPSVPSPPLASASSGLPKGVILKKEPQEKQVPLQP